MQIGSKRLTADGNVDSSFPTRVFCVIVKSASSAAVVTFSNGTSNSTPYDQVDGTTSQAVAHFYPGGLLFPDGCYVDVDTNTSYVTVIYCRENNA